MADLKNVKVTSSPHIRTEENTRSIMLDVILALIPILIVSVFMFGARALVITLISVASAVGFEWLYEILLKKPITITDGSAVITGMLLAYTLPVTAPWWLPIIGSGFAIIIVKQLFGGLGKNFMNPALGARAFLFSWPVIMTTWVKPHVHLPLFATPTDVVTAATPMAQLKLKTMPDASFLELALGQVGGCLGETCALVILAAGLYLIYRKVITPRIPVAFLGTVAVLTFIFPRGNDPLEFMLANLLSGGLMLGAIFMATDYSSSPVTKAGQWIYGVGCGLLTVFIRYFGSYPEGVSYAILIMNCLTWFIDQHTRPTKFGFVKKKKEAAKQ